MASLFGSSGIRGPFAGLVTPDLALLLGSVTASARRRVLVGHDVRLTSPLLSQAFTAGALAAGGEVAFAGPAATPSLAYAARDHEAAVVVTASHNPPQDNGFKFWNPDGSAWGPAAERALEEALARPPARAPWRALAAPVDAPEVSRRHAEAILRFAGPVVGPVVLDCGNGAGAYVSPLLLGAAGPLDPLHCEPDGRFPHRPSEPSIENLEALRQRCRAKAWWGIAHDGDADRMVAVDPEGQVLGSDVVLVALALYLGARRIATPIDAGLALQGALPDVAWELTRVGDAHVSARVAETGADLGAETSGTYIVPGLHKGPDGPLAAVLLLHAAADGLVGEARERLRPTVRRSEKLPSGGASRDRVRTALAAVPVGPDERATTLDGLRIDTADGWLLVRPSGTEPLVRITVEAWDAARADRLLERARGIVGVALSGAGPA